MTGKVDNRTKFGWSLFYLFSFLCVYLFSRGISSISLAGSIVLLGTSLFMPKAVVFQLIIAISPLGNLYKISGLTIAPFLIVIYIIKVLICSKTSLVSKDTAIKMLLAGILFIMSLLSSFVDGFSLVPVVSFFLHLFFLMIVLSNDESNGEDYQAYIWLFIASSLLVCFSTVIFPSISRQLGRAISIYSTANSGFSTTWDFGRLLCISIALLIVNYLEIRRWLVLHVGLILVFIYFIIQCGRFSILLGLFALLLCVPFAYGNRKQGRHYKLTYTILMLLAMIIVFVLAYRFVYPAMTSLRGVEASDNGRFDIWRSYLSLFSSNIKVLLFGVGGGAISEIASKLGIPTAHNIILEKIIEFGIFGTILLLSLLGLMYRGRSFNIARNPRLLPLIAFIGTSLTQGTTSCLYFPILLAICFPQIYEQEE